MTYRHLFILGASLGLGACATVSGPTVAVDDAGRSPGPDPDASTPAAPAMPSWSTTPNPRFDAITTAPEGRARDHAAILAMQGEYRVSFDFEETVTLAAGYERHEPKTSGGFETVIVVENEPDHVVLQHILVAPNGFVTKHWRQDWTFETTHRFEFVADQTWEVTEIPAAERPGTWTQCVYEVSDAPRYCGTGTWNHRYGVSTWTSDRSWRPLPRREYTKRTDYNALNVENRHTITPDGWTHEQDNTKVRRDGRRTEATLVRESGFNDYRNIEGYDFSPAYDYWEKTSAYWAQVRDAWSRRLVAGDTLVLNTTVDGMAIIGGTFGQADAAPQTPAPERASQIEELLNRWTEVRQTTAYHTETAP